jgi:hypothetical protein
MRCGPWTKALGQLFGYSAYAVATALAVFLGSLVLGSAPSRDGGLCARMESRSTPGATASAKTDLDIGAISCGQVSKPAHTVANRRRTPGLASPTGIAERQCGEAAKDSEARGTTQNNQYEAQYWLAIAQREQGLLAEAESTVDYLLADQPEHQAALAAKASLSSQRKEWPAAVEAQEQRTQLRPESAAERCNLGDVYLRANNLTEAEAPLLKGLRLDSYAFLCHRDLHELYRATGRTADGIKELEWVVRLFSGSRSADVSSRLTPR